jgi:hypothetical protein
MWPDTTHPDGDTWLLNGSGKEPCLFDPVVRTHVIDFLARPELRNDIEGFIQHVGASRMVGFLTEKVVLDGPFSAADPENDPAVREPVQ